MASVMSLDPMKDEAKRLKTLKFSRRGKKSSITKRVDELERLVGEKASRKRVQFLMEALLNVYKEITEVCLEIAVLSDEIDEKNDLELYKAKIDSCGALVTEYLDSRREEPPSSESMCSTWVKEHAVGMMEGISQEGSISTGGSSVIPDNVSSSGEPSIAEEPLFRPRSEVEVVVGEDCHGTNRNGEISGGIGSTMS